MLCFRLLYAIVLSSDVFDARARVCVVHWHCTAQLSMFNMEKRFRNKIIIIIIIIKWAQWLRFSDSKAGGKPFSPGPGPARADAHIVLK